MFYIGSFMGFPTNDVTTLRDVTKNYQKEDLLRETRVRGQSKIKRIRRYSGALDMSRILFLVMLFLINFTVKLLCALISIAWDGQVKPTFSQLKSTEYRYPSSSVIELGQAI